LGIAYILRRSLSKGKVVPAQEVIYIFLKEGVYLCPQSAHPAKKHFPTSRRSVMPVIVIVIVGMIRHCPSHLHCPPLIIFPPTSLYF
jgi:hypothetical protein